VGRVHYETIRAQIKVGFNKINFGFDKNMQGDRCLMMDDVRMTQKRK
jgi:hypothetical protein